MAEPQIVTGAPKSPMAMCAAGYHTLVLYDVALEWPQRYVCERCGMCFSVTEPA